MGKELTKEEIEKIRAEVTPHDESHHNADWRISLEFVHPDRLAARALVAHADAMAEKVKRLEAELLRSERGKYVVQDGICDEYEPEPEFDTLEEAVAHATREIEGWRQIKKGEKKWRSAVEKVRVLQVVAISMPITQEGTEDLDYALRLINEGPDTPGGGS